MTVTVKWPMFLPTGAGNQREHWRTRHKRVKAQRSATRLMLLANRWSKGLYDFHVMAMTGAPDARLAVRLTRVSPRPLDDDNNVAAFKAIRDEVAAYFGMDDRDPRLRWEYAQAKGRAAVRIDFAVEEVA